jgi:hypothetical protein
MGIERNQKDAIHDFIRCQIETVRDGKYLVAPRFTYASLKTMHLSRKHALLWEAIYKDLEILKQSDVKPRVVALISIEPPSRSQAPSWEAGF